MKEGKDNIKDLFSDKLTGYEGNVRPELWANISSQIGVTANIAASTGLSILTKSIIGISIAASVVVLSVVLINNSEVEKAEKNTTKIENQKIESNLKEKEIDNRISEKQLNTSTQTELNTNSQISKVQENILVPNKMVEHSELKIKENKEVPLPVFIDNTVKEDKKAIVKPQETIINQEEPQVPAQKEEIITENKKEDFIKELPNIFTPNGDRINDYLTITSEGLTDFSIVVLDQKSTIVYRSNDPDFIWDGTGLDGEILPSGMYVYYITARDPKDKLITRHSLLEIKR